MRCGGHFDIDSKKEDLIELSARIEDPTLWDDPAKAQEIMQQKARLEQAVKKHTDATSHLEESSMFFEMGMDEGDQDSQLEAVSVLGQLKLDDWRGGGAIQFVVEDVMDGKVENVA